MNPGRSAPVSPVARERWIGPMLAIVGTLGFSFKVYTIGLGAIILGEPTHLVQLFGAALVLSGVLLTSMRQGSQPPQRRE